MNRKLTLSLFLAIAVSAAAQTPTVVEKPANKATAAKPAGQNSSTNVKPSPAVKTSGTTQKSVSVAKPTVVAVQPVTTKPVTVPATKALAATSSTAKPVAVAVSKTSSTAKPVAVAVSKTNSTAKPVAVAVSKSNSTTAVKPAVITAAKPVAASKPVAVARGAVAGTAAHAVMAAKPVAVKAGQTPAVAVKPAATTVAVKDNKPAEVKKTESRKITASGRRDPFISPVVNLGAIGSGCSSGKRCLAIDQIALKGVVRSDNGMIAVVVNAMDKAYFLRENDPVFNGYVVKITADSIIFKETFHDKLGKPLTRDVTKSISRPVA